MWSIDDRPAKWVCILSVVTPYPRMSNIAQSTNALVGLVRGLGLTGTGIACVCTTTLSSAWERCGLPVSPIYLQ